MLMDKSSRKLFAGAQMRNLRNQHDLTQKDCADRLGISPSYLNQIENNQRPLTAAVILALVEEFKADISKFTADDSSRKLSDLREILHDPVFSDTAPSLQELKIATSNSPEFTAAFLALHNAYQSSQEQLATLDDLLQNQDSVRQSQPYEEVRDFFHYQNNYIDTLDRHAEDFAIETDLFSGSPQAKLSYHLKKVHNIDVQQSRTLPAHQMRVMRGRTLSLNENLPPPTGSFQLLQQIAFLERGTEIDEILKAANFKSKEAREIARLGLGNYFAGAALMPYRAFLTAAQDFRHDLELLAARFGASIEQVAHRLSTMQRAGEKGVPFFFLRVDRSGTITKRHSATQLQFARFGGACPLWNVHQAFERPGEFVRQLAITPDNEKYFCVARTITKRTPGFHSSIRRYSIGLGCNISHAKSVVYADDLNLDNTESYDPIGISCRICERTGCLHRSVPPIGKTLRIDPSKRSVVPFSFDNE
jgi:predicted transcriptional regulator/transcriptional regulator with XRE-family HTH domain